MVKPVETLYQGGKPKEAETKMDYRDARRGGYYWLNGEPYPSVTTIIGVLDKPALRSWFGKEVWRAMAADPTLSEKDALGAPYKISTDAKDRGQTIHSIVEAYENTQEYIDNIPEKFRGYAQAFYRWAGDNGIAIAEHEHTVVSAKYSFAGTLDLLVRINQADKPVIVDVKTGKDIYPEAFLQLSAYRQALKEEGTEVAGVAVVLLQEDGSYKYQFSAESLFREFFACKVLWEWMNRDDYGKMKQYAKEAQNGQLAAGAAKPRKEGK